MWKYNNQLLFPVEIKQTDLFLAKALLELYAGSQSALGNAIRYSSQKFSFNDENIKQLLTNIAAEEFSHWEIIGTMISQLMQNATIEEIKQANMCDIYAKQNMVISPCYAAKNSFCAKNISTGDNSIGNLCDNLAAEQKSRSQYEHMINLTNDKEVIKILSFLRQREIVHFQRFGEALNRIQQIKND